MKYYTLTILFIALIVMQLNARHRPPHRHTKQTQFVINDTTVTIIYDVIGRTKDTGIVSKSFNANSDSVTIFLSLVDVHQIDPLMRIVAYANVGLKNSRICVTADKDGHALLKTVASGLEDTLKISYIGYGLKKFAVKLDKDYIIKADMGSEPPYYIY